MITKIFEKENILGDNIGRMEKWDFSRSNMNDESRLNAITTVASICYKNPKAVGSESLYNRLLAESKGLPSSSFEFIPVYLSEEDLLMLWNEVAGDIEYLNIVKYGMWINDNKELITNFRAIVYDVEAKRLDEYWLKHFNDESECDIIKKYIHTFLFKVDFPTRSQMVRHRVNLQEVSRRFVSAKKLPFSYYISKDIKDKHTAIKMTDIDGHQFSVELDTEEIIKICEQHYFNLLDNGVKPQSARRVIPQAGYTELWMSMNSIQLDNYLKLRLDSHSQWEIQQTALAIKESLMIGEDSE